MEENAKGKQTVIKMYEIGTALFFGLLIGAWMYSDAKERNYKDKWGAFVFGLFFSILGLIVWFMIRPKTGEHNSGFHNKQNNERSIGKIIFLVGGLFILIVFLIGVSYVITSALTNVSQNSQAKAATMTAEEVKNSALIISYDELMRNNENYIGKIVHYTGGIVQVSESSSNNYVLRVATRQTEYGGYIEDVVWVNYRGTRLLEGDIIDFYGKVKPLRIYTAVLGNEITVPEVDVLIINLISKAGQQ